MSEFAATRRGVLPRAVVRSLRDGDDHVRPSPSAEPGLPGSVEVASRWPTSVSNRMSSGRGPAARGTGAVRRLRTGCSPHRRRVIRSDIPSQGRRVDMTIRRRPALALAVLALAVSARSSPSGPRPGAQGPTGTVPGAAAGALDFTGTTLDGARLPRPPSPWTSSAPTWNSSTNSPQPP